MADQSGQTQEAPDDVALSARRVLRARRRHEPKKKAARWGLLAAMIAVPLTAAAALALRPTPTPADRAQQPVAQAASVSARELPDFAPEPAPETAAVAGAAADPAHQPELQRLGDWLRVRAAPDANAVHVIYATAGGRFDIRAGDMIVDLCDRAGAESAPEISAALANDAAACLVISRGGQLLRATRRPAHGEVEGPAL